MSKNYKKLLAGLVLQIFVVVFIGILFAILYPINEKSKRNDIQGLISTYNTEMIFLKNGEIHVTDNIRKATGYMDILERTFDLESQNKRMNIEITSVTINNQPAQMVDYGSSIMGDKFQYELHLHHEKTPKLSLDIYHAEQGYVEYTISYLIKNSIISYLDLDYFSWEFLDTQKQPNLHNFSLTISHPFNLPKQDSFFNLNSENSVINLEYIDASTVMKTLVNFETGQHLKMNFLFPKDSFDKSEILNIGKNKLKHFENIANKKLSNPDLPINYYYLGIASFIVVIESIIITLSYFYFEKAKTKLNDSLINNYPINFNALLYDDTVTMNNRHVMTQLILFSEKDVVKLTYLKNRNDFNIAIKKLSILDISRLPEHEKTFYAWLNDYDEKLTKSKHLYFNDFLGVNQSKEYFDSYTKQLKQYNLSIKDDFNQVVSKKDLTSFKKRSILALYITSFVLILPAALVSFYFGFVIFFNWNNLYLASYLILGVPLVLIMTVNFVFSLIKYFEFLRILTSEDDQKDEGLLREIARELQSFDKTSLSPDAAGIQTILLLTKNMTSAQRSLQLLNDLQSFTKTSNNYHYYQFLMAHSTIKILDGKTPTPQTLVTIKKKKRK